MEIKLSKEDVKEAIKLYLRQEYKMAISDTAELKIRRNSRDEVTSIDIFY